MSEEANLFLDVISILPDGVECFIQAPSLEDDIIFSIWKPTKYPYYTSIILSGEAKHKLVERLVQDDSIMGHFQRVEIRDNDKLLFEGYDGVEFGMISKDLKPPQWFIDKHLNPDSCIISQDW